MDGGSPWSEKEKTSRKSTADSTTMGPTNQEGIALLLMPTGGTEAQTKAGVAIFIVKNA